ncbi:MAG: retroviral-like aspartic protease family protein [Treponema sp.]|jgi:clan AA aspartic protease|nr:retroviral-like aspartic protease family protein [Treponema sp.]
MSIVYTEITLKNGGDVLDLRRGRIKEPEVRQTTVTALVDTGAWTLVIDDDTCKQLGLEVVGTESTTLADGSKAFYQLAGPVEVHWKDRRTSCDAIVLPSADEILLGAIPLEAMDLMVHPRTEEVVGAHGDLPVHLVKGGVKHY